MKTRCIMTNVLCAEHIVFCRAPNFVPQRQADMYINQKHYIRQVPQTNIATQRAVFSWVAYFSSVIILRSDCHGRSTFQDLHLGTAANMSRNMAVRTHWIVCSLYRSLSPGPKCIKVGAYSSSAWTRN